MSPEKGPWPKKGSWLESGMVGIGLGVAGGMFALLGAPTVFGAAGAIVVPLVGVGAGVGLLVGVAAHRGLMEIQKMQARKLERHRDAVTGRVIDKAEIQRRAEREKKFQKIQNEHIKEMKKDMAKGAERARAEERFQESQKQEMKEADKDKVGQGAAGKGDPTFSRLAASERKRGMTPGYVQMQEEPVAQGGIAGKHSSRSSKGSER